MNSVVKRQRIIRGLAGIFAATLLVSAAANASDDFTEVRRLVQAQGEDYIRARNALLGASPRRWDVSAAAVRSWEAGLAAFILNARLAEREAFLHLDDEHPNLYANGKYYRLSRSPEANLAFLLEKMWKAPGEQKERKWAAPPERERECAFETLVLVDAERFVGIGEAALWTSMWEQSPDDRYRFAAVSAICSDPDPSTQAIIVEILQSEEKELGAYSKFRCLEGLRYRDTEHSVLAILDAWAALAADQSLGEKAITALSMNESERARRFIRDLALDATKPEWIQRDAMTGCCLRPHQDDGAVLYKFFTGPGSVKMKADALQWVYRCPSETVRPVIREILSTAEDKELLAAAAMALNGLYKAVKEPDPRATAEDIALLEWVRRKENLSPATRVHIGMYIERLRGNPRPKLPDRPPDP